MNGSRFAVVASGFLGAEIVGAAGFALGAGLLAFDLAGPAIAGVVLAPVLVAAGGPLGYDLATWWVDDERAGRAEPGSRAAVHVAGVAGALFVFLVCLGVSAAAPTWPTAYLFLAGLGGLPVLAVAGRRLALRFVGSTTLLPMSLVATVVLSLAVVGGYIVWVARMFDAYGGD